MQNNRGKIAQGIQDNATGKGGSAKPQQKQQSGQRNSQV
jgi:hypothetical protein